MALFLNIDILQVIGYSLLVINWMGQKWRPLNILLADTIDEVKRIAGLFRFITFQLVHRERNQQADRISKIGLLLGPGLWQKWEHDGNHIVEDDPGPNHFCL